MVKCAECGYMTVRSKVDYLLGETALDFRERGVVANGTDDKGNNLHPLHEKIPLCFARQPYLRDATKDIKNKDSPFEEVKRIIQKDIDCTGFTEWQQGFTPKEHREMMDREKFQEWQDKQRKEDKHWRIIELIVLGVIATLVAGGFTILGAFIARGK